jgi:hypothetical protein
MRSRRSQSNGELIESSSYSRGRRHGVQYSWSSNLIRLRDILQGSHQGIITMAGGIVPPSSSRRRFLAAVLSSPLSRRRSLAVSSLPYTSLPPSQRQLISGRTVVSRHWSSGSTSASSPRIARRGRDGERPAEGEVVYN